jgi:hypothetical protein
MKQQSSDEVTSDRPDESAKADEARPASMTRYRDITVV